jgi:hypothetical protein
MHILLPTTVVYLIQYLVVVISTLDHMKYLSICCFKGTLTRKSLGPLIWAAYMFKNFLISV